MGRSEHLRRSALEAWFKYNERIKNALRVSVEIYEQHHAKMPEWVRLRLRKSKVIP
jgi:hypothetical protein